MRTEMRNATGVPAKKRNDTAGPGGKRFSRLLTGIRTVSGTLNRCGRQIYNDLRTVTPLGWR